MPSSRFSNWHVVRVGIVPLGVVAALLLIGGVAHSAPLRGATQAAGPVAPVVTSTTLTVSPIFSVAQGTRVTLTATMTPTTAVGAVQFKDGSTDIGSPVTVSNDGTASGFTSRLALGSHSVTAVFTSTNPAVFSPSTSPAVPLTVTGSGAGVSQTGAHQRSGLSLDVRVSVLGDRDERVVVLDECRYSSVPDAATLVRDGQITVLDGRSSVLDGQGLLDGVFSIKMD